MLDTLPVADEVPQTPPASSEVASPPTEPQESALARFDRILRATTPPPVVTWVIVAVNVALFIVVAVASGRVLDFTPHVLLQWGADYAPWSFRGDWWRQGSSLFVHGGLTHLAGNMFFLLLAAPLVERLVGPVRFAVVYLFAGVAGGLWSLGWFPAAVSFGASGAVYGVYGCFLGCYLRGMGTVPWQIFFRQIGLLLLFTFVSLAEDYLALEERLIAHGMGLVYGFVAGLLFGCAMKSCSWKVWLRKILFPVVTCFGLIIATVWWVEHCTHEAITILGRFDTAIASERELVSRFQDVMRQWEEEKLSTEDLHYYLKCRLIPELHEVRKQNKLSNAFSVEEEDRLSIRTLLNEVATAPPSETRERRTLEDFEQGYRLYLKLRLDSWRTMADRLAAVKDSRPPSKDRQDRASAALLPVLMDEMLLEFFRKSLDEMANEKNPLRFWLDFTPRRSPEKRDCPKVT